MTIPPMDMNLNMTTSSKATSGNIKNSWSSPFIVNKKTPYAIVKIGVVFLLAIIIWKKV